MRAEKKIVDEINITPLTDIFLVLLIIMMVVAPMLHYRGLPVAFSAPGTAQETPAESKTLLIEVNGQGRMMVSGAEIAREDLLKRIREDEGAKTDGVVVKVDPEASLEAMTYVLNSAQLAGIEKVAVEEGDGAATSAPPASAPATP